MPLPHGKNFRRLLAQALAADQHEMRALFERILPRGEGGARVLRLASEPDRQAAPLAIVAALSADAITADQAENLLDQVTNAPARTREEAMARWEAEECHKPPPERRPMPLEIDPLADFYRWLDEIEVTELIPQGDRLVRVTRKLKDVRCCSAVKEAGALVNNNENTSAPSAADEAGEGGRAPDPL